MRQLIALSTIVLAACSAVITPNEVLEQGERTTTRVTKAPAAAAGCMSRNLDTHTNNLSWQTRSTPDDEGVELIVRATGSTYTVAVAEVRPRDVGSDVTIWMNPGRLYNRDQFIPNLLKGC